MTHGRREELHCYSYIGFTSYISVMVGKKYMYVFLLQGPLCPVGGGPGPGGPSGPMGPYNPNPYNAGPPGGAPQ